VDPGKSHVVIAGIGRFGQIVARILTAQGIPYTALDHDPIQIELVRRYGNKVYYGDAAQLHLLKSANVAEARLFVLAVGNIETSVRIAERVKQHFPGVRVYARAINRKHALALRALGCEVIMRDTLLSSLFVAEQVLISLGYEADNAHELIEMFQTHDAETLDQQFAIRDDDEALIQTSIDSANELRFLFQSDADR
jgi:glutathione-regulated potassium-efflux system ancillary protein KefC/glutathione-regulated potassium-efflux system protein KefB